MTKPLKLPWLPLVPISKSFSTADEAFADACREWLKSCSCAPPTKPHKCKKCTKAFLKAVRKRAKMFNAATGTNSLNAIDSRVRAQRAESLRPRLLGSPRIIWHDALHATVVPTLNKVEAPIFAKAWFAAQQAKGIKAVVDLTHVNQDSKTLDLSHSTLIDDPKLCDDVLIVDATKGGIFGPQERVRLMSRMTHPDGSITWGYDPIVFGFKTGASIPESR